MGDIGGRHVRYEVLPASLLPDRVEPVTSPSSSQEPDARPAPARTEPART